MGLHLPTLFSAGLLTFLSPCVLPLVPFYLSMLAGTTVGELREGGSPGRVLVGALSFSLGLGSVFVAMGMASTALGSLVVTHRELAAQLGGLMVFLLGLKMVGWLKMPWLDRDLRPGLSRVSGAGPLTGFLMGAAFALGWSPCVGPVLGSVLTFTAMKTSSAADGALYLGAYAAGLVSPLIALSLVAPAALRVLHGLKRHLRTFEVVTGATLCALGLLLMTDRLSSLMPSLSAPAAVVAQNAAPPAGMSSSCEEGDAGPASCAVPDALEDGTVASAALAPGLTVGPAMIEFVSSTCTVCQRMMPVVATAERDCAGQGVKVVRTDVNAPGASALAAQFRVRGVPTFLFIDNQGQEVARLVGEQSLATLKQSLEILSSGRCEGFRALPSAAGG